MPRTTTTKFKRQVRFTIGGKKFSLFTVCVYHEASVPATIRCYTGDVIVFVNCSKKKTVSITFDHSPFLKGNPKQIIKVLDMPVSCPVVGPQGQYTSDAEASGMTSGQPDGPAVIVQ